MIKCCDRLAIKLQEHVNNPEFNIYECISNETLEMILANMYGEEPSSIGNRNYEDLIEAVEFMQKAWFYRMGSLALHPDFIYKRSNLGKKENEARRKVFDVMQEIFKNKLDQPKKSINDDFTIIDQIINNFDIFSDDEKIQNIVMFLIAGYETTAKTVSSTLLLLAMNSDIQEKVFNEINGVFFADDIEFDVENLNKLQYTTQVLNESMRLLTTTPVIMRTTLNDILLDDQMIPKQTDILMNFYALHRRKDIWGENAEKFDPENFAPEKVAARHPYSFLPFSAGKRNCIGYRYAYISMKIMLVKILKLYKISTRVKYEDLRIASDILLRYSPGPIVKLSRRRM